MKAGIQEVKRDMEREGRLLEFQRLGGDHLLTHAGSSLPLQIPPFYLDPQYPGLIHQTYTEEQIVSSSRVSRLKDERMTVFVGYRNGDCFGGSEGGNYR